MKSKVKDSITYYYLESSKVKVFPCAYRGTNIDTGARLNIEYNLIKQQEIIGRGNTSSTLERKTSYIISAIKDASNNYTIKCIIGGYNFELNFYSADVDIAKANCKTAYLCVKSKSGTSYNSNSLTPWDTEISEEIVDDAVSGENCFLALCFSDNTDLTGYFDKLTIFDSNGNIVQSSLYANTFKDIESNLAGTQIAGNLTNGTADGSISQINNSSSVNTASAKNAIALGENTIADKENLVAIGKYNTTEAGDLFVVGNGHVKTGEETEDTRTNVFQVNEEKIIINKQTTINGNESLSGDLAINTNKFKVTATSGNTEIAGTLVQYGQVDLGKTATDTTGADARSAVKIGKSGQTTEILGNEKIAGTLKQSTGQVEFGGNVAAKNGLDITNADLTVGGTNFKVTIAGAITSTSDATIASGGIVDLSTSGKQTEVKGSLKVDESSILAGAVSITNTTKSTSSTTGALKVSGGVGITGALNTGSAAAFGGLVYANNGLNITGAALQVGDSTTSQATNLYGALTQYGNSNQVSFEGNIDAKNGLDVSGASLNVGNSTTGQNAYIWGTLTAENNAIFKTNVKENNEYNIATNNSHAEGNLTIAKGSYSHAEGKYNSAYGSYSHAEGWSGIAGPTAIQVLSITSNTLSVAAGSISLEAGQWLVHVENFSEVFYKITSTSGWPITTVTLNSTPAVSDVNNWSLIECNGAFGDYSHTEGFNNIALAEGTHTEGCVTKASGNYSHTEGYLTTTETGASYSHAEGCNTTASGSYSHAEGYLTKAALVGAHAEGYNTNASQPYSHAEGFNTIASDSYSHAAGKYNYAVTSAEVIGGGSDDTYKNIRVLDWSGNETIAGALTIGKVATSTTQTNGTISTTSAGATIEYNNTNKTIEFKFN